jgi:hypothetical protein
MKRRKTQANSRHRTLRSRIADGEVESQTVEPNRRLASGNADRRPESQTGEPNRRRAGRNADRRAESHAVEPNRTLSCAAPLCHATEPSRRAAVPVRGGSVRARRKKNARTRSTAAVVLLPSGRPRGGKLADGILLLENGPWMAHPRNAQLCAWPAGRSFERL